jgi:hypothetical protein
MYGTEWLFVDGWLNLWVHPHALHSAAWHALEFTTPLQASSVTYFVAC